MNIYMQINPNFFFKEHNHLFGDISPGQDKMGFRFIKCINLNSMLKLLDTNYHEKREYMLLLSHAHMSLNKI